MAGKRWSKDDRKRFAEQAAGGDIGVVAQKAKVKIATVKRWIRDFNIQSNNSPSAYIPQPTATQASTIDVVLQGHIDATVEETAKRALYEVQEQWYNFHLEAMDEMDTMWESITIAEDQDNHESPYVQILKTHIDFWAEDMLEKVVDAGDWTVPEGVAEDVWDGLRDQMLRDTEAYLADAMWEQIRNS